MSFRSKGTLLEEEDRTEDVLINFIVAAAFGFGTAGVIWIVVMIRCGLAGSLWP